MQAGRDVRQRAGGWLLVANGQLGATASNHLKGDKQTILHCYRRLGAEACDYI
jgi:hypothetical protein